MAFSVGSTAPCVMYESWLEWILTIVTPGSIFWWIYMLGWAHMFLHEFSFLIIYWVKSLSVWSPHPHLVWGSHLYMVLLRINGFCFTDVWLKLVCIILIFSTTPRGQSLVCKVQIKTQQLESSIQWMLQKIIAFGPLPFDIITWYCMYIAYDQLIISTNELAS